MRTSIVLMMTIIVFVFTATAAAGENAGAESAGADKATLSDLSWLTGYWMSDKRGALMEELWLRAADGVMIGLHRDAFGDGHTTFEYLRIMQTADGLVYYATPGGYDTTKFKLTKMGERDGVKEVVFENPEHDFPQLIRYSLSARGLMAQVEGLEDDERVVQTWIWQRSPFPGDPPR